MTITKLKETLVRVYCHDLITEEAWKLIDADREAPNGYSKEYWLPLEGE